MTGRGINTLPLYFGQFIVTRIRKEQFCDGCSVKIEPKSFVPQLKFRAGKGAKLPFYMKRYHNMECFNNFYEKRLDVYKQTYPLIGGRPLGVSKFEKLTPEQINERHNQIYYLTSRDRPYLLKAYQQKSTIRVHRMYALMHKRFSIMHSFGVSFPFRITSDKSEELTRMIYTYDAKFAEKFGDTRLTIEEKLALLIRNDEPNWDAPLFTGRIVTTKEMKEDEKEERIRLRDEISSSQYSMEDKEQE